MSNSRREFLRQSSRAAAGLALGPLALEAAAAPTKVLAPAAAGVLRAQPVPLERVRVTGGPLKHAQELTAAYLLSLDPDRMMSFYRTRAGLSPKAAPYPGWDGGGRNLTGHIAGHHLSAVSLMYAATGDNRFRERASYLVRELREVQLKNADGYLGALDGLREAFAAMQRGDIRSSGFDLNGLWSPWYTLHKTFAGLRDAYRYTGNRDALEAETRYAMWAEGVLAPMSDELVQRMLNTEHGGMNEVLADLSADTGDERWMALSRRFEHHAFTDALKRHQDNLNGKHGNCQIPKLIGSAARYGYAGDAEDIMAASFFWDRVTQHHSYATGGHGLSEYFGPPDKLAARVDGRACESCNAYNMLKLTRMLFSYRPDAFYADFHERALFNHVLASIDPTDGRTSYMVPVGRGVGQEYQDMARDFTCCVGTGMESHALHGLGVYYETGDTVWVNQFVPSTAQFTNGVSLTQETSFPDGSAATLQLEMPARRRFTLAVRRPAWAGDGFELRVNGEKVPQPPLASFRAGPAGGRSVGGDAGLQPSVYVQLTRDWKSGDTIELALPKALRLEPTDNPTVTAIMWGPLVLAGDHGPRSEGMEVRALLVPALVAGDKPLDEWIIPGERPGNFTARAVGRAPGTMAPAVDVALAPFFRTHRRRYSVYFDLLTPAQFDAAGVAMGSERARLRRLAQATIASAQPGDASSEQQSSYRSTPADRPSVRTNGRTSRGGAGSFSFELPVDPSAPTSVVVTYYNEPGLPAATGDFDILADSVRLAHFVPNADASGFHDAQYDIPPELSSGKTRMTIEFRATEHGRITPVFAVRTCRRGEL